MTRPLRADARRNRERLLAAADAAFAEGGTEASLEDVAHRAGVAIGTLYRHFPTRHDLIAALLEQRFTDLHAAARATEDAVTPESIATWLELYATRTRAYRGLPTSIMTAMRDGTSDLSRACHAMREAGADLVRSAQRAGVLRADLPADDLLAMAAAIAWLDEQAAPDPARAHRLLALVLRGAQLPA